MAVFGFQQPGPGFVDLRLGLAEPRALLHVADAQDGRALVDEVVHVHQDFLHLARRLRGACSNRAVSLARGSPATPDREKNSNGTASQEIRFVMIPTTEY